MDDNGLAEVVAIQYALIVNLQTELQEIKNLAYDEGFDTTGSARDCFVQMREDRNGLALENTELNTKCEKLQETIEKLEEDKEKALSDAGMEEREQIGDIEDALSEYLHSLGLPARPLRSTGHPELDSLIRTVLG